MTIFTILLVLLFVVGIPYLIYKAFIDNGGFISRFMEDQKAKQDDPIDQAQSKSVLPS